MLKKIICLKNIGIFKEAKYTSPELKKVVFVYGENGRGKTTLSRVLRSCLTGDPSILKQNLDGHGRVECQLLFENGHGRNQPVNLTNGTWNNNYPDILIFDTDFIDKNVCSGAEVKTEHRQKLLDFAIGEDAVKAKKNLEAETENTTNKAKEIKSLERNINCHCGDVSLDEFIGYEKDWEIEKKIIACQTRLNNAQDVDQLFKQPIPEVVDFPDFDLENLINILNQSIECIGWEAEQAVNLHISAHPQANFEQWLSQGKSFEDGINCPYCNQAVAGNILLKAYQNHFNHIYKAFQDSILEIESQIVQGFSQKRIDILQSKIEHNRTKIDFWQRYVNFSAEITLSLDDFNRFAELCLSLLRQKQTSLLDLMTDDGTINALREQWQKLSYQMQEYNNAIQCFIDTVEHFKQQLSSENILEIRDELSKLKIKKLRYAQDVVDLVQGLQEERDAHRIHQERKKLAKENFEMLMSMTLKQYQVKINALIRDFGARFEIVDMTHSFVGSGSPRSTYALKVKGKDVDLSDFATALSEGDKRTLAFAFFVARISTDPRLSQKVVVVDDPVCSLDGHRRSQTKRTLMDICQQCKQLVLLGHDAHFLRSVQSDVEKILEIPSLVLQIKRMNGDFSDFVDCNLDDVCGSGYYDHYKTLHDFKEGTGDNLKLVAKSVRPLLEGYLHLRFPVYINRNQTLGKVIKGISSVDLPHPLAYLKPFTTELHEINNYASQFHHDADYSLINEGELLSYVERTLLIIHKGSF